MCRLAAYVGPQIPLENIVTAPQLSLLFQSKDAYESKVSNNGDGFGIAWYGSNPEQAFIEFVCQPGLMKIS